MDRIRTFKTYEEFKEFYDKKLENEYKYLIYSKENGGIAIKKPKPDFDSLLYAAFNVKESDNYFPDTNSYFWQDEGYGPYERPILGAFQTVPNQMLKVKTFYYDEETGLETAIAEDITDSSKRYTLYDIEGGGYYVCKEDPISYLNFIEFEGIPVGTKVWWFNVKSEPEQISVTLTNIVRDDMKLEWEDGEGNKYYTESMPSNFNDLFPAYDGTECYGIYLDDDFSVGGEGYLYKLDDAVLCEYVGKGEYIYDYGDYVTIWRDVNNGDMYYKDPWNDYIESYETGNSYNNSVILQHTINVYIEKINSDKQLYTVTYDEDADAYVKEDGTIWHQSGNEYLFIDGGFPVAVGGYIYITSKDGGSWYDYIYLEDIESISPFEANAVYYCENNGNYYNCHIYYGSYIFELDDDIEYIEFDGDEYYILDGQMDIVCEEEGNYCRTNEELKEFVKSIYVDEEKINLDNLYFDDNYFDLWMYDFGSEGKHDVYYELYDNTILQDFIFQGAVPYLVDVPDSYETIGSYSFAYCPKLANIFLGNNVKTVMPYAFDDDSYCMMDNLYINTSEPPIAPINVCNSDEAYNSIDLYVPGASSEAYRSHPIWSKFSTIKVKPEPVTGEKCVTMTYDFYHGDPELRFLNNIRKEITSYPQRTYNYKDKTGSNTIYYYNSSLGDNYTSSYNYIYTNNETHSVVDDRIRVYYNNDGYNYIDDNGNIYNIYNDNYIYNPNEMTYDYYEDDDLPYTAYINRPLSQWIDKITVNGYELDLDDIESTEIIHISRNNTYYYTYPNSEGEYIFKIWFNDETTIPDNVFNICGCYLKSVNIPECVDTIGNYAFYQCYFNTIELPKNMSSIKYYSFDCNLNTVISYAPYPPQTYGYNSFNNSCFTLLLNDEETIERYENSEYWGWLFTKGGCSHIGINQALTWECGYNPNEQEQPMLIMYYEKPLVKSMKINDEEHVDEIIDYGRD